MPGATNATLTLANVSLSASGTYSVLVTNSYGSDFEQQCRPYGLAGSGHDPAGQRPFRHRRGAERFGNSRPG